MGQKTGQWERTAPVLDNITDLEVRPCLREWASKVLGGAATVAALAVVTPSGYLLMARTCVHGPVAISSQVRVLKQKVITTISGVVHLLTYQVDETAKPDQGIISAAIANATALLRKPLQKGQENLGVLDQESKAAPKNSQFTFTCDPDTGKGVAFPEQSLYAAGYSQRSSNMPNSVANSKFSTHGTQTSPNIAYQNNQNVQASQQTGAAQPASAAQGKKTRRRRGDAYAFAARQRRLQQEYSNMHHPPSPENIWICEFCEYEGIFGEPPAALIRQYEIKDRRERRKQAERRRLLEKAKLKARKGKKQSKNGTKAGNNTQQASSQGYDQQPMDPVPGEDYLDDGYDDDPIPMPAPPQAPVKQPMPGSFDTAVGATGKGGAG